MLNRFQKFVITTASVSLGTAVIHINSAQAFDFSFNQTFGNSGTLTGEFSGTDTNGNGQLDGNEFTIFNSLFQGSETGFENVSWGLTNLAPFSFFVTPNYYSFWVTAPATNALDGRGWRSNSSLGDTVVGYTFSQDGPIAGRYFSQEPLSFTPTAAIPEPTTIAGLTVAGLGMVCARRHQKRKPQKTFKQ
ncbi:PEP-CTERM sorting domain-containing protein [Leptothermofonsia sp. ETS-13]|uniref:PEP-CTERM sorting domain-containing protein n=1 Tax=Leptothermofonsia sp. ETS-13 TaxID=3035696 RepID=UPI003BA29181